MQNLKWSFVILILIIVVILFVNFNIFENPVTTQERGDQVKQIGNIISGSDNTPKNIINEIITERNVMSNKLNNARKVIGQLQCEASKDSTNAQGGWCKSASTENGGQHMTDSSLIPVLSKFLTNKTVSSFGDGPGAYKREIQKLGHVKSYDAYDGAPYCEETSAGRVKFLDLTVPQYGIPLYDWIISLEVAEHIPSEYESIYLDNIFRHAKEGIILSWAVPGQGGLSHINNRPLDYVINVMVKNGFKIDETSSKFLQGSASLPWIQSNLYVYRRIGKSFLESPYSAWFL